MIIAKLNLRAFSVYLNLVMTAHGQVDKPSLVNRPCGMHGYIDISIGGDKFHSKNQLLFWLNVLLE